MSKLESETAADMAMAAADEATPEEALAAFSVALARTEDENMRLRRVILTLANPIPSTKGMGPKDRADRLHAEMERRIFVAKEALS